MRVFVIFVAGLLCALSAAVSAVWVAVSIPEPESAQVRSARELLNGDAAATRRMLSVSCTRDVQVERLLLELTAGSPEGDARDVAALLERSLGGHVDLYVAHGRKLEALGDAAVRASALLARAAQERIVEDEATSSLLDACKREERGIALWVARSVRVAELLEASDLAAESVVLSAAPEGTSQDFSLPLYERGRLFLSRAGAGPETPAWLWPAALSAAGAFVLGALFALFLARRAPVEEAVLSTLERAAERVAQGDLSSTIQLRVGGRADQTFRSFDRMTADLRETRAKLAEAERAAAWQDMAQRVAHEIKNPLSPIKMGLETLRKAHDKNSAAFEEIFDESTHAMLEEVQRIEQIVREFSDFARLPRARPGALDLAELTREVAKLYTPADVALALDLEEGLSAHADRAQISQVIVNLLANAIDAAKMRGTPRIAVSVSRERDALLIRIDDSGPGVPESERERIFEPYVTHKTHGSGLGLAIVRRIVQDHGGSVAVSTSPLGGARFELKLPQSASIP